MKEQECEDDWSLEDTERLLTYMSRVFMLQFPLYLAAKQVRNLKLIRRS